MLKEVTLKKLIFSVKNYIFNFLNLKFEQVNLYISLYFSDTHILYIYSFYIFYVTKKR